MKLVTVLTGVSVALNALLGAALLRPPVARDSGAVAGATPTAAPAPKTAAASRPAATAEANVATESWADLTRGELPDILARLRAEGVPPRLVRTIMGALVAERFADKHRELVAAMAAKPWWEGQAFDPYADPKVTAMRRALAIEERNALYRLLGPEEPASDYDRLWRERRYGAMSSDKIEKFRSINQDYSDLMAEAREQARDIILPEDRARLAFLEEEKRKDIDKLLSADEQFEFELRSSPTTRRLRDQLAAFDPTEEEFRAIFKIHAAIDARFGGGRVQNLTQEERRQRRDAVAAADAQIKDVLSPERFVAYQRAVARPGAK